MAQGNIVERFFIALGLDTKDVEKGITKTVDTVKSGLKEMLVGAVLPAVGALASGALVQQFTEEITQVDRLSKSLGINIERLQQWQGVAENAGVAGEEIGEIFADLNDWMVDADQNQSGAMYEYIEKGLLPAVRDVNGAMKSTEQYALELADAFAAMDKQQATGIGRQIGIGNAGLVAMFQQGSASISAQMQQIKQLGVYTQADAEAAQEFAKASRDLFRALKMMLLPVFRLIAPIATMIANGIQEMTKHAIAFMPVIAGLAALLATALYPWLVKNAAAAMAFIASPWGALLAALAAIGLLLDDFATWLDGGQSAFGEFYESIFGNAENAQRVIDDFVNSAKAMFNDFKTFVVGVWDSISPHVKAFGALLLALGKIAWDWAGMVFAAVQLVFEVFRGLITGGEDMSERVGMALDNLRNSFNNVLNSIKNYVAKWWEFIAPIFDKVTSLFNMGNALGGFFGGDVALATPATAGTTNNSTTNNDTKIDGTVNVTIQGNADRAAIEQAQKSSGEWFAGAAAQANMSQAGV